MKRIFFISFLLYSSFVFGQNNRYLNIIGDNNEVSRDKTPVSHNAFHASPARVDSNKKSYEKDTVDLTQSPLINTKTNKTKVKKKDEDK